MATYSIRDLEKLSGIKAHTIRIWEQRYNIIEPKRTATNIRYYTDEDLQYLLNVAFLNRNEIRISKIAKMSKSEIMQRVASISQDSTENANQQQALTMAMIELNEFKFEQLLNAHIQNEGFQNTVIDLIVPFLEKLSILWLTGSISTVHEQFINHIIKQKIAVYIDKLGVQEETNLRNTIRVLLFEQGEDQEVLLSLINYLLRNKGCKTMYLGKSVSLKDIKLAFSHFEPNLIFASVTDNNPKNNPAEFINQLSLQHDGTHLLLLLRSMLKMPGFSSNVMVIEEFSEFLEILEEI